MTGTDAAYDVEERRIRIDRAIAETETFVAEPHGLLAEAHKLDRDARFAPVILIAGAMTAGAAVFKLFGR